MQKPTVLLIASQMPQQELGLIAQLFQSQGFRQQPASERPKNSAVLVFETADKTNSVAIKFYQEIGALRLELTGDASKKIGQALDQYMEGLTPDRLGELFEMAQSDMERRVYAVLLVLAYPDGVTAMNAMRDKYFTNATTATKEGVIQGLAFLETPDVGIPLEEIEKTCAGTDLAVMARRAIDGLCERGLIRESLTSFMNKIRALIDDNPQSALDQIEKYEAAAPTPEIRALHARALRLLGRNDEASSLLVTISIAEPDAVEAYCERALIREAGGQAQQAMGDVQAALTCDPDCAPAKDIFSRLKLVLDHSSSKVEDRYAQFSQALEANPEDVNLLVQRAECLMDMNRHEEAVRDLKDVQRLASNDLRLPMMLAECWLAMRYLGSALEQASKAQKIHPASQETMAWILKPRVFMAMNLPDKALSAIHEIPADMRDNDAVVLCEAMVEEILGKTDEAQAHYEIVSASAGPLFDVLKPSIYAEMPLLKSILGSRDIALSEPPAVPMDQEPVDPFFKRCAACGALTMQRRTYCRECSNGTFF